MVNVFVSEGHQVARGLTLVVLELMKMQTQLRAANIGKVRVVAVHAGDQIEKDTLLVCIDATD